MSSVWLSVIPLFTTRIAHLWSPNSIPLKIRTVFISDSSSSLFFSYTLRSYNYTRWLIFVKSLKIYPEYAPLYVIISGIIAITRSRGDRLSPWNIPLGVVISPKIFPSLSSLVFHFCTIQCPAVCSMAYMPTTVSVPSSLVRQVPWALKFHCLRASLVNNLPYLFTLEPGRGCVLNR